MKSVSNFIRLIFVSLLFFGSALGCSYIGYPDPPVSYIAAKTGTIFIGHVISSTSTVRTESDRKYRFYKVTLKVEKALKGVDDEIQEITLVESITHRTSCTVDPPKFKKGERWLIHRNFAEGDEVGINLFGSSHFAMYMLNPENQREYLEKLENAINNPVTTITGQIQHFRGAYLRESVEVILEGNDLKLATKTDKSGFYSFENLPPANYRVKIRLPYETKEFVRSIPTIFDAETNVHNLTYDVSVKKGDVEYRYLIVAGPRSE